VSKLFTLPSIRPAYQTKTFFASDRNEHGDFKLPVPPIIYVHPLVLKCNNAVRRTTMTRGQLTVRWGLVDNIKFGWCLLFQLCKI